MNTVGTVRWMMTEISDHRDDEMTSDSVTDCAQCTSQISDRSRVARRTVSVYSLPPLLERNRGQRWHGLELQTDRHWILHVRSPSWSAVG